MGMLLKKSIETITFDAEVVQTIYYAPNQAALMRTLASLEEGLNNAVKGTCHEIRTDSEAIIQDFVTKPKEIIRVHLKPGSNCITFLCSSDDLPKKDLPKKIQVDGHEVVVTEEKEVSFESLSALIQELIDRTKVKIVAAQNRTKVIEKSVNRLDGLYSILQANK
eukprot:scaffold13285_cov91-Cylindrotheca_fusiformis.AAC.1